MRVLVWGREPIRVKRVRIMTRVENMVERERLGSISADERFFEKKCRQLARVVEIVSKNGIEFTVNGNPQPFHAYPMARLLDVLRDGTGN